MDLQNIKSGLLQILERLNNIETKKASNVIALAEAFVIVDQLLSMVQTEIQKESEEQIEEEA